MTSCYKSIGGWKIDALNLHNFKVVLLGGFGKRESGIEMTRMMGYIKMLNFSVDSESRVEKRASIHLVNPSELTSSITKAALYLTSQRKQLPCG